MAKKQKLLNKSSDHLFHKIQGSECNTGATPPMLKGMGVPMTDISSPNKILPAVVAGAKILGGLAVRHGAKRLLQHGVKKLGQRYLKKMGTNALINTGKQGVKRYGGGANLINKTKNFLMGTGPVTKGLSMFGFGTMFLGGSGSDSDNTKKPENTKLPDINGGGGKGPYVKPGGKATGNMKDYALGSDSRKAEYDARGWKYDDTIKGYNRDGSSKTPKPVQKRESKVVDSTTPKPVQKKEASTASNESLPSSRSGRRNMKLALKANDQLGVNDDKYFRKRKKAVKQGNRTGNDNSYLSDIEGGAPYTTKVQDSVKGSPFHKANCKYRK